MNLFIYTLASSSWFMCNIKLHGIKILRLKTVPIGDAFSEDSIDYNLFDES